MNQILSLIVSKFDVSRVRPSKSVTLLMACCVALSCTPLRAQVGSQANTLLEVQALRQEVAQLRDMVERQQYELGKMQRLLQKTGAVTTAVSPQSISSSGSELGSSQPPSSLVTNGLPLDNGTLNNTLPDPSLVPSVDNNTGAIDASVAPISPRTVSQTVAQSSNAVTQSNEKTYPPVVEIAVGNSVPKPQEVTQVQPIVQTNNVQANNGLVSGVTNQVVDQVNTSSAQVGQAISQSVSSTVVDTAGISVADIKPIETISAGSIVSVPAAQPIAQPTVANTVDAAAPDNQADAKSSFSVISESDYYQQGFGLLKESKHQEAVTVFQQQIKSYPQGERADDAYYWIAESMYVNRKLSIAKENYKAIVQGYPKSERLPDAMLKLAYIEQEQGNIIEARILLQEIMQFHPKSDAALSAKNRLSELN